MTRPSKKHLDVFRHRLTAALLNIRTANSHAQVDDAFYIALGMQEAASCLGAIHFGESALISDAALNAASYRAAELSRKLPLYNWKAPKATAQEAAS